MIGTQSKKVDLLIPGEHELGQYQVQIAHLTGTGWAAAIPPLYATVTNRRLLLIPQTLKPYPPASIPYNYITRVRQVRLNQRSAVLVGLKQGYEINLFVGWGQAIAFFHDLQMMLTPKAGQRWTPALDPGGIERLINRLIRL